MVLEFLTRNWERLSLERFGPPSQLSFVLATPRFRASGHVVFLVLARRQTKPILVAKVPRLPGDHTRLNREAANLKEIHSARPGGFHSIPLVIAYEDWCGIHMLVETALTGHPMSALLVRRQTQSCINAIMAWLTDLHSATASRAADAADWFERLVERPLDQLRSTLPVSAGEQWMLEKTEEVATLLRHVDLPLVFEHGDLSSPNILVLENGSAGVVDWELGESRSLPGVDLFFFLTFVAFARRRARRLQDYLKAFHEAFFGPEAWARSYVTCYAKALQLPHELLTPLFVLCWSRYVAKLVARLNSGSSRLPEKETVAWLRANRFYALWHHTIDHRRELNWTN